MSTVIRVTFWAAIAVTLFLSFLAFRALYVGVVCPISDETSCADTRALWWMPLLPALFFAVVAWLARYDLKRPH
jgi:H+/Cl- antiporter ClcA